MQTSTSRDAGSILCGGSCRLAHRHPPVGQPPAPVVHIERRGLEIWDSRLQTSPARLDDLPMTSTARLTVHLVVRRHVDLGMTRSAMCVPA